LIDTLRYFITFNIYSRVLNRPGGTCQISLGGYTEEELERMRLKREAKISNNATTAATAANTENEKKGVTNEKPTSEIAVEKKTTEKPEAASASASSVRISSNAFASSSTTNSFNVLTDRPTSKVSNQPGGRTNFTLG